MLALKYGEKGWIGKEKMTEDWYSPSQVIRFKEEHIDFICVNYEQLCEGVWPSDHNQVYKTSKSNLFSAQYETPTIIMAEFHWRLAKCGRDGGIFQSIRCMHYDYNLIKKVSGLDNREIDLICFQVTGYIKGRRKDRNYYEVVGHRRRNTHTDMRT